MRRTVYLLGVALLVLPSLGSDSPKEYDGATDADDIQGTWEEIRREKDNRVAFPDYRLVETYRGGTFIFNYEQRDTIRGTYRLDPGCKPPHLDCCPSNGQTQGRTLKLIYEVKGDTLRIGYLTHKDLSRRPQGFDDDGVIVAVYKRVK
jgi:uncharacterized protein (TIGR03067 family)